VLTERLAVCHRLIRFLSEEHENYSQQVRDICSNEDEMTCIDEESILFSIVLLHIKVPLAAREETLSACMDAS
jgi:hypothetical protein